MTKISMTVAALAALAILGGCAEKRSCNNAAPCATPKKVVEKAAPAPAPAPVVVEPAPAPVVAPAPAPVIVEEAEPIIDEKTRAVQ